MTPEKAISRRVASTPPLLFLSRVLAALAIFALASSFNMVRGEELAPSAVLTQVQGITLDANETYHVRDLYLVRGDLKIYLTDGTISFATPVAGRKVAMVFSAVGSELGDAELIVMPPRRSDRESLVRFAKSPNLNEHFSEAIFLFTDDTYKEVHQQLEKNFSEKTPEVTKVLEGRWNPMLHTLAGDVDVRLAEAILNRNAGDNVFEGIIQGRSLGAFDVSFQPEQPEAVTIGTVTAQEGKPRFQIWASFEPRHHPVVEPEVTLDNFRIDVTIGEDLKEVCTTDVSAKISSPHIRAIRFDVSERMKVTGATVDGEPAEFYQRSSVHSASDGRESTVLLVAQRELDPAQVHQVAIHHEGTVLNQTENGVYMVADRIVWFPHRKVTPASFDLTFHVPSRFEVVSIGSLVDEKVEGSTRTVHRKSDEPLRYAGFNFGEFVSHESKHGPYVVETYANKTLFDKLDPPTEGGPESDRGHKRLVELSDRAESLLDHYIREWGPLPYRTLAISPIPAYFGQGFPGLIYLSTLSYLHLDERPPDARSPLADLFFTDILLAHEIAHQWWGNLVAPADYRSEWIMESIANYAAIELMEESKGAIARDEVLRYYTRELLAKPHGKDAAPETAGPIEWGQRLIEISGPEAWRIITYDKGTWICHMLCQRMGREAYHQMLREIIRKYSNKSLSNEEFRLAACKFMPPGMPDPRLELFFDTWVYGTGVPHLALNAGKGNPKGVKLEQSGVAEDFTVDVPVTVLGPAGQRKVRWVRSNSDGVLVPLARGQTLELPPTNEFLSAP